MLTLTTEQAKLREDLIAQYGETVYRQAQELSGLTLCLVALGNDELSREERAHAYRQASLHLAQLLDTLMSPAQSARVTECAKRMDAALDIWMADQVEQRDGLGSIREAFLSIKRVAE